MAVLKTNNTEIYDDISEDSLKKLKMIMGLRNRGITSTKILKAMETVPRENYITHAFAERAYEDRALPIECGQTISQPYIVAYMSQELELTDRMKVLEIGTGSGYQASILSKLARRVYTIERYNTLHKIAEKRFQELNLYNITAITGDGLLGWHHQAPFDRIIITAAAERIPRNLIDQLKDDGIMILPLGPNGGDQRLLKVIKTKEGIKCTELCPVRFVPLVQGVAKQI
ncbi:MAG: protein-L-isoaspartate(D-aspartate) O-methyltransferase [Rhizobiales bacterium]|nr:protein-L-isoaspartate(D-aspartate) O-methyltransferase [Hyphomicrobiales bacterium]